MSKTNMVFFRIPKTKNYTVISNYHLNDPKLSGTAKGLLTYLLSCDRGKNDWILYKSEILKHFSDGKDAINTAFANLEKNGYLETSRTKKGRRTILSYVIHEIPEGMNDDNGCSENKNKENGCADFQYDMCGISEMKPHLCAENPTVLNTNINTNILTTTEVVVSSTNKKDVKTYLKEKYGFVFSENYYDNLIELCDKSDIKVKEYIDWFVKTRCLNSRSPEGYMYKVSLMPGVIDEYVRSLKKEKTEGDSFNQEVICPKCNHKFGEIDFITRTCVCGLSLREFENYVSLNKTGEGVENGNC